MIKSVFKIVLLCFFSFSVSGMFSFKFDAVGGTSNATQAAVSNGENGVNKVNAGVKKVLEKKEKLTGELQALKEKANNVKNKLDEVKEVGQELYEEGSELYGEGAELYAKGEDAVNQGKEVASSIGLKREAEDLQKQMDDRKSVITEDLTAKLKASQANEQVYQQLYDEAQDPDEKNILKDQLAEAQATSTNLQKDLAAATAADETYFSSDPEYAQLQQEYESKQNDINEAIESSKEKGQSIASSFSSKISKMSAEDKKSAYSDLSNSVFVGANEKLNSKTAKKVKEARRNNLINAASNAFVLMTEHQRKSKKFDEDNDQAVDDCEKSDSLMTKLQFVNALNVSKNNLLFDNLSTDASSIELKISTDMLHQDYKLGNPDKNPAEINLDNYVFKEEELKEYGLGSTK